MSKFVHLHLHTEYSFLDGLDKVQDYVDRAVKLKMPAMAVTDHGNLSGAPEFYMAARKAGIEPIVGSEFYYVPDFEEAKERAKGRSKGKEEAGADNATADGKLRYHVILLGRGRRGYRILSELSTSAH